MAANSYDWIYMTPAIVVLFVNILFLIKIMWVSGLDWFRSYPQSMIASFNQPPELVQSVMRVQRIIMGTYINAEI